MTAVKSAQSTALPADVRAWGRAQNEAGANLPGTAEGTRGRLNPVLRDAYNAKHRGAHRYAEPKQGGNARPLTEATVKPEKGRAVTRKYDVREVRAALVKAGEKVGARGTIPEALVRKVILGTIPLAGE